MPEGPGPGPDRGPDTGADAARQALARARAAAREQPARAGGTAANAAGRPEPAHPAGRDPVLVGDPVRHLVRDRGWAGPAAVAAVVGRWAQIVGPQIAEHVRPETFDAEQGRLVLRADSSAWAGVLRLQTGELGARIEQEVGPAVVRHITVLGPAAPSWKHGPLSVRGRGPRDTYG